MSTLAWILLTALAGGVLSVGVAALAGLSFARQRVGLLVSYAIGTLLGAVFLEIVPHAFEEGDAHQMALVILLGILVFFILEKLVLWRHCHHSHCEAHGDHSDGAVHHHAVGDDQGRAGVLILVGDTFHNFVDGVLIAAAFLQGHEIGMVTALAIIAHEIPQELGDFIILLHSGYSRVKAFFYNLLSSLAMLLGGLLGYFALSNLLTWIPVLLGLAAANMIYIAVADLIPGLHKRTDLKSSAQQVVLILLGILSIAVVQHFISHGGH